MLAKKHQLLFIYEAVLFFHALKYFFLYSAILCFWSSVRFVYCLRSYSHFLFFSPSERFWYLLIYPNKIYCIFWKKISYVLGWMLTKREIKKFTLEISYTYPKNDFLLKDKVSYTFPHTSPSPLTWSKPEKKIPGLVQKTQTFQTKIIFSNDNKVLFLIFWYFFCIFSQLLFCIFW